MDRSKDFIIGEPLTKKFLLEISIPETLQGMLTADEAFAFGLMVDNLVLVLQRALSSPATLDANVSANAVEPFRRTITMSWAMYKTLMSGDLTELEKDTSWLQRTFQQMWSYVHDAQLRQLEVRVGHDVVVLSGRDRPTSLKQFRDLFLADRAR